MRIGFSKIDITPDPAGQEVYGLGYWFRRSIRFTGVRDRLFVRCAALGEGPNRSFIISVDSTLDSFGFCPRAGSRIAGEFKIPESRIFITCTHTHSSPLIGLNSTQAGREYGKMVEDRIVQAACEAGKTQREATVSICQGKAGDVLYNRRPVLANGKIPELHGVLDPEAIADPGPVNDTMTLIRFFDPAGILVGAFCHFGIHGVCIQCSELISGDCMGRAIGRMEKELNEKSVILFLNGPCGDIDPKEMGGEPALEKTANLLHEKISGLLHSPGNSVSLSPETFLTGTFRAIKRKTRTADEIAKLQTRLEPAARQEKEFHHHSGPGYELFLLNEERELSLFPELVDIEYRIVRLGDLVLVGVEGEVFTRFGLILSGYFTEFQVLVVGLTGGWKGYLPFQEAYAQGGYEVTPSRWSRLEAGETEKLLARIQKDILSSIKSKE
jgi:neutral ceramidase